MNSKPMTAGEVCAAERIFLDIAWRDFVTWAWEHEEMRAQFERETGVKIFKPATNPIDAMIDDATGITGVQLKQFVIWVTQRHWGVEEAPEALRKEIEAQDAVLVGDRGVRDATEGEETRTG